METWVLCDVARALSNLPGFSLKKRSTAIELYFCGIFRGFGCFGGFCFPWVEDLGSRAGRSKPMIVWRWSAEFLQYAVVGLTSMFTMIM